MRSALYIRDDSARWAALIDENLPPRALWPTLTRCLPGLRYPSELNVAQELLRAAESAPHATAIVSREGTTSYRTLRDRVLNAAGSLTSLGVEPADRVAFRLHNTPEFIVTWLAIQWVGAIAVPIPPVYRRREIAHAVNHSGAKLVVVSPDLREEVERAAACFSDSSTRIVVDLPDTGAPAPPYPTASDAPAQITYVTASSGCARGVVSSPAEILASADTYAADVLDLSRGDVCLGMASMAWAFGLGASLVFPLRYGASTVLVDPSGPLPAVVADLRVTVLFAVPTMYRLLLKQPDFDSFDFSSLRRCVSAAEPLPASVVDEWQDRTGLEVLDGLGTTELTHIFISSRSGSVRAGTLGTPVTGYEARILGEDSRDCPAGTPGLLAVRGPTGARYWRDAHSQRAVIADGWTLTGDICVRDAEGHYTHLCRTDDLIVSGGYKISPAEVEHTLREHADVSCARVFGVADATRGMVPSADVVLKPGTQREGVIERLQRYLKQELAPYKCPRVIQIVETCGGLDNSVAASA